MRYWWVVQDALSYKGPETVGKPVLAIDMITPGFVLDTTGLEYRFIYGKHDSRRIGDFASWGGACFFVSDNGFRAIKPMFLDHGKVYPVLCSGMQYYIVIIDTVLDALDIERSEYERFGLYQDVAKDVSCLKRIVLKHKFHTDTDIFRLAGNAAVTMEIIVSDKFREVYSENNLTGLVFKPTSLEDAK